MRLPTTDGPCLAYRFSGFGPPVVLIHGSGTDNRRWNPVIPLLERAYSVYSVDRRGYGCSEDSTQYQIESDFQDIATLIRHIGKGPVDLVGHSYGALCALGLAQDKTLVRRVVAYEPPIAAVDGAYFKQTLIGTMRSAVDSGDPDAALAAFLSDVFAMDDTAIHAARKLKSWETLISGVSRTLRELENVHRLGKAPGVFRHSQVPILLLVGEESPPQYHATARALQETIPGTQVQLLPGQGHGAIDHASELFCTAVVRFLAEDHAP